ncbi:zinc ribbon domain-containing protein [Longibaculum muris]|uniref:zinc ribbon domain-containing protein n=1 Tax=Longibaculum muris TaxID=1796628 RepID=UPI0018A094D5|nr:zinc ribbon domain-containing protein [Longibaculum muris]
MECPKCHKQLLDDANYCEQCGAEIKKAKADLEASEVKKNMFGLLAMFSFLIVLILLTILPVIAYLLGISLQIGDGLFYIGYAIPILFEIIAFIKNKNKPLIDMQKSGMNYGSAAMVFSLFMIIARFARVL